MAQKGEFKPPIESASQAFARTMDNIDSIECGFALYMIAGQVRCMRESAKCFKSRIETFKNALIGVYTEDVDVRVIKQDIDAYYEIFK